ncbi:MAG: DEAD/DEAH box helicase family protein, partial [Spirochaetia bacterium]|nr:DEAD/DEAH box helicase family protein [Spirochaetia bacterium]
MTSFKSAQLIANSKDADKVIFLMDRIELGTQSLEEYRNFAEENDSIQATEDTRDLITKLKSTDPANTLIVTSIQKMSNIKDEEGGLNSHDIEIMNSKRIVFIVDEAHRSTFGEMLTTIKDTFTDAIFFGFTGTPIHEENQKKMNTTSSVFGDELHRYSIADGIRDKNVLGFDPYKVLTCKDIDLRKAIALEKSKAGNEEDAFSDENKKEVFNKYMNDVKMAGYTDDKGAYIKGIEDYIPSTQYRTDEHKNTVVEDILENWTTLSQNGKFHAIFATSSIVEAIEYYRLLKEKKPKLKITALFDSNIDNNEGAVDKELGLAEIIEDYNKRYEREFTIPNHSKFKKDVAARLAHKDPYLRIANEPEKQLDLLIVVDQMLTGFDSKWINTLYMDKKIEYENIIQAFSRTNRLFGPDKPFGTIRYYRYPHTMQENIEKAVKLYSGDKPLAIFVERLGSNISSMISIYGEISELYRQAGVEDFSKLPEDKIEIRKFLDLFRDFNKHLEAAKIQGFSWDKTRYEFESENEDAKSIITIDMTETDYLVLAQRYKEVFPGGGGGGGRGDGEDEEIPYEIDGHLNAIDTGRIDTDYMNSKFEKYLKVLKSKDLNEDELQKTLNELHKSFAMLNQEEQKFAGIFLRDVQNGDAKNLESGKTFRDYITEYQYIAKDNQIKKMNEVFGLDEEKLRTMLKVHITDLNINEYGRLDDLKNTVDKKKASAYFEKIDGTKSSMFQINIKIDALLKKFILSGGFDLE